MGRFSLPSKFLKDAFVQRNFLAIESRLNSPAPVRVVSGKDSCVLYLAGGKLYGSYNGGVGQLIHQFV